MGMEFIQPEQKTYTVPDEQRLVNTQAPAPEELKQDKYFLSLPYDTQVKLLHKSMVAHNRIAPDDEIGLTDKLRPLWGRGVEADIEMPDYETLINSKEFADLPVEKKKKVIDRYKQTMLSKLANGDVMDFLSQAYRYIPQKYLDNLYRINPFAAAPPTYDTPLVSTREDLERFAGQNNIPTQTPGQREVAKERYEKAHPDAGPNNIIEDILSTAGGVGMLPLGAIADLIRTPGNAPGMAGKDAGINTSMMGEQGSPETYRCPVNLPDPSSQAVLDQRENTLIMQLLDKIMSTPQGRDLLSNFGIEPRDPVDEWASDILKGD